MRLKNILIVVSDIEKSKAFYKDLFGLNVITDFGENVILTEGLVLQEETVWKEAVGRETVKGSNASELYFEEFEFDKFLKKLENSEYEIEYITHSKTKECERRVVRFYDPDKHMIEVAEHV